jgi:hypothetical protein
VRAFHPSGFRIEIALFQSEARVRANARNKRVLFRHVGCTVRHVRKFSLDVGAESPAVSPLLDDPAFVASLETLDSASPSGAPRGSAVPPRHVPEPAVRQWASEDTLAAHEIFGAGGPAVARESNPAFSHRVLPPLAPPPEPAPVPAAFLLAMALLGAVAAGFVFHDQLSDIVAQYRGAPVQRRG